MPDPELSAALALALRAAEIARDVIMPVYDAGFSVEYKADGTPVTAADRGAEEQVRSFFERETPGWGVLGEEFGETIGDGRHRWVIDPIDGTKSFIHHVPLFGTLVALERDGEPVVGVIALPALGQTVAAAKGHGATRNGEPVRVSTVDSLGEATVCLTTMKGDAAYQATLARVSAGARLVRTWGDCYGYFLVATGRAEAMLDPEMDHWDVAALYPVIREAGGQITTWEGEAGPGASSVASNGRLHVAVLAQLGGGG